MHKPSVFCPSKEQFPWPKDLTQGPPPKEQPSPTTSVLETNIPYQDYSVSQNLNLIFLLLIHVINFYYN